MSSQYLDRQHLKIVLAVVEQGNITRAAERLHLSQSALSHSIRHLENHLNIKIWRKEGRQLELTPAGQKLYQFAQKILPQFEYLENHLKDHARGRVGFLRVGMECHPCYQWLLRIVADYLRIFPQVDVDVRQQVKFKGAEALLAYEVDMLITPDPITLPRLTFLPVFPYEQVLVVSEKHTLAAKESISAQDLCDEILITYPVPKERLDIFSRFLWPNQADVWQHKTSETTEMMLHLVAENRGVSALPLWLVKQQASHLPIKTLRLGEGVFKHIHLGMRNVDMDLDYIKGFIKLAQQQERNA